MLMAAQAALGMAHVWDGCRLPLGYPGRWAWICQQTAWTWGSHCLLCWSQKWTLLRLLSLILTRIKHDTSASAQTTGDLL